MKRRWIDAHVHVSAYGPDGERRERFLDDLVAMLDACDADLRLVLSVDGRETRRIIEDSAGALEGNRFIYELTRGASGRLYGSCTVNPHFLDESLRAMDACFGEWGFVQLGEMLQYMMDYKMDSPEVETIVRRAVEFDAPVQVHVSTSNRGEHPSSFGMAQLEDLFAAVQRVPEAKYILAHAVGMPDDDPPVVAAYLDAVEKRFGGWPDNFWMEIRDFDSPGVRCALERVPAEKLLAGTDWTSRVGPPFLPYGVVFGVKAAEENPYPPCVESMVGFLKQAGADADTIERIGWRNAAELYGLSD